MAKRPVVVQRTFLSFDEELRELAALEVEYSREGAWRQSQSLVAVARWHIRPQRPRTPWQSQQVRISMAATTLVQRANAMRRRLRLTPAKIIWGW